MLKRKQFDIFLLDLNPSKGSEQKGIRPCVIIETNATATVGQTTIIAPITSQLKTPFSYEVILPSDEETGLSKESKIKMRQIRVIDISRLIKKIGVVPKKLHNKIRQNIAIVFDLENMF